MTKSLKSREKEKKDETKDEMQEPMVFGNQVQSKQHLLANAK